MQIVIDINDNEYLGIKNYPDNITSYPITIHLYDAVRNGIPLPKGHGRLIDADELEDEFGCEDRDIYAKDSIREAQTIIEADKESEVEE